MKKSIIAAIIGAVAVLSVASYVLIHNQQQTNAQEQHFQDCKSKYSDFYTRQSRLIDRIGVEGPSNDLRLQYSALGDEAAIITGECKDVIDKLLVDESLRAQEAYINNQLARNFSLRP